VERLFAGIGQAYRLDPEEGVPTTSNVFAELYGRTERHWTYGANIEWNPHTAETQIGNAGVQYRSGKDNVALLRYRFLRDRVEAWQYAVYWRVSRSWQLIASQQYDVLQSRNTERIYGFQYDSCCWGFRIVSRDFVIDDSPELSRTIFFEFVLKGLSNVGQRGRIEELLNRAIIP
jgi:LPS-assembly protein